MSDSNPRDLIQADSDDRRRDGLSLETAMVIRAENTWIGVGMEYEAVSARHGPLNAGWTLESQRLRSVEGRRYDALHIVLNNGERRVYHFDITDFYGEPDLPPDAVAPKPKHRRPMLDAQVKIDQAAIARVLRYPEADVLWAEAVRLGVEHFARQKTRALLAEALVAARVLRG